MSDARSSSSKVLDRLKPSEQTKRSLEQAALVGFGAMIGAGSVVLIARLVMK